MRSEHDTSDADADYRQHLIEARYKAHDDYDKTLVLLAGGALGLSLNFMSDIIGSKPPKEMYALAWGWGLLVVSLLAVLSSFCISRFALMATIKRFDAGKCHPHRGGWAAATEACNILAGISFIAGVSFVAWFAHENLGVTT